MARPKPRIVPFPSDQLRPAHGNREILQRINVYLPFTLAEAVYEAWLVGVDLDVSAAAQVTLPWRTLDGKPRTSALLFTGSRSGSAISRSALNTKVWQPARRAAGISDSDTERGGMHQLRHHYASVLLAGE